MTSVNTNAAAITALRTLQNTQAQLDSTQSRISTGYKIGEAKDNAAYWAISTTLKSDNKALGTVKDALGLGASTVDVAYQSLTKAKDVLDEIKSKLVAATQDGVDKTKVQSEIAELQKQLKAIAASANFSGENWLNVDTSVAGVNLTKKVVSSYSTDGTGSVSIGTINVDTSSMVLINNAATKEGILNGGKDGMTTAMTGGLSGSAQTAAVATAAKTDGTVAQSAATSQLLDGSNQAGLLTVDYKIDGQSYQITRTYAQYSAYTGAGAIDGSTAASDIATFLNSVLTSDSDLLGRATVSTSGAVVTLTSKTKGTAGSAEITDFTVAAGSGSATGITVATINNAKTAGANAKTTMTNAFAVGNALTLDDNDSLTFDVLQGTAPSQTTTRVTINKALISDVLSSTDGKIANVNDYKAVLTQALKNSGLSNITVSDASGQVVLTGGTDNVSIANVTTSTGTDLTSFDMSNATSQQLTALISAVNSATQRVVTAASTLGSIASRIDMQKSFVNTLMDTIDKGVSNLIDADMTEESTKLQALQVKSQLGTQALSIANQSAQSVLSLFRS